MVEAVVTKFPIVEMSNVQAEVEGLEASQHSKSALVARSWMHYCCTHHECGLHDYH